LLPDGKAAIKAVPRFLSGIGYDHLSEKSKGRSLGPNSNEFKDALQNAKQEGLQWAKIRGGPTGDFALSEFFDAIDQIYRKP